MIGRSKAYIQTCKGRKFYPLVPVPDFDIDEIARGLAAQTRWRGQFKNGIDFYGVAQHSVLVSRLCSPRAKFWGLMHDAPEWLIGDMPSPIKGFFPDFEAMDERLSSQIIAHFGIPYDAEIAEEVHRIDKFVAQREADALLTDPSIVNGRDKVVALPGPAKLKIRPWSIGYARAAFLMMFKVINDAQREQEAV